jgi:hypothetical protein
LGRDSLASRHLRKALEMDEAYGEASYVLGLISERAGQKKLATEYVEKAGGGKFIRTTLPTKSKRQHSSQEGIAPLFRVSSARSRKLITGGDRRLAEALKEDALNSPSSADIETR